MITLSNVIQILTKDNVIVQSYIYSDKSVKYWRIERDVVVQLSTGDELLIPAGYCYDMATVPKWLWSVVRPFNDGLLATLIHDYLYVHKEKHMLSRAESDREYLKWLTVTNNNQFDNTIRYLVVRAFGWLWWNKIV